MHINSKNNRTTKFRLPATATSLLVLAAVGLTSTQSVHGQSGAGTIEEIVITSRRYEESVNDAPVAVNVLSQSYIEKNRIDRVDDIFSYTPGATYESFSKLQPTASIRGLVAPTPGNASSESSIQMVIDNVVVTKDFMKGTPLYDLSRVEVLRGPQGTSFGRNASAGLLHFVTNRPELGETSGSISGTVGSDERFELNGFYNVPLSDTSALRISFNHDQEDGQTDGFTIDETTNEVISLGGIDGEQVTALRVQLATDHSDNFSSNFKVEYSQDRDESPIREMCNPTFGPPGATAGLSNFGILVANQDSATNACDTPFEAFISEFDDPDFTGFNDPAEFKLDRNILTFSAEFEWALDNGLNITSVTGYMDGDTENLSDIIGTAADINWQGVSNDGNSLSTELRVDNVGSDSSVQWLGGFYLLKDEETRRETLNFQQRNARGGPFVPTVRETGGTGETSSWSVFGEITFDLSDRATLTYGGRYLQDDKDYITRASGFGVDRQLAGLPGVGANNGAPASCAFTPAPDSSCNVSLADFPQSASWSAYISKLSLDYALSDTVNAYALYSEGFKSGTFQPDALNQTQASVIVEPEESTNFEIGLKGEGSSYRYAITLFDIELEDVQTVNQVDLGNGAFAGLVSNVGFVQTTGLEFDGAIALTDSLTISGGFAFLDSEIGGNTPDPEGLIDPDTGNPFILDGQRPGGAPDWTVNIAADYLITLSSGASLNLRADFRGRDDVYFQNRRRFSTVDGSASDALLRPSVTDFGAQATWTNADEDISVTLWGKNLREDVDITNISPFVGGGISDFSIGFRGKREFGLTAIYDF